VLSDRQYTRFFSEAALKLSESPKTRPRAKVESQVCSVRGGSEKCLRNGESRSFDAGVVALHYEVVR
jgi:hypothetical protein